MTLFDLRGANIGYNGRPVLHDVTLTIRRGERIALVGASGAGKSTLLAALYEQQRERAAFVPQDLALVKQLSAYHNVYIGRLHTHRGLYNLLNLARPMRRHVEEVRAILAALGLEDKLFTPVSELSGGQQQRTAVARALYRGAEVLLGDEFVSAVDGRQSRIVLRAATAAYDTMVMAVHDVELALEFTTRIIGLKDGRVVLDAAGAGLSAAALAPLYR